MGIEQTTVWTCEVCGRTVSTTEEAFPYSDPVVGYPNGEEWDYVGEFRHEKFACPACVAKDKITSGGVSYLEE